jgi:lysine decarboxylase
MEQSISRKELENLVGRISANMILPYPPGVPLLMPGEMITEESPVQ